MISSCLIFCVLVSTIPSLIALCMCVYIYIYILVEFKHNFYAYNIIRLVNAEI